MKKKIIMLCVCVALLVVILIQNMSSKTKESEPVSNDSTIQVSMLPEDAITRAEAFRLVSYLYYTDEDRNNLSSEVIFEDASNGDWYDEYVQAVYCAGFDNQADSVNNKYYIRPYDDLVWHEAYRLFNQIAESFEFNIDSIYQQAGIEIVSKDSTKMMTREQFLQLYEVVVPMINQKNALVHMESLYVLAVGEDGSIITQNGSYTGGELFYMKNTMKDITKSSMKDYIDKKLSVLVSNHRIVYVRGVMNEETVFQNAYLIHGEDRALTAYIQGVTKEFTLSAPLNQSINGIVGNITYRDGQVISLSIKPDIVTDKVVLANENYIELEHYGKVEYDDHFQIYKVYGNLSMEQVNAILVGYSNTKFVLTDHKISAALITEPITAANIRVMIKTSNYKKLFHEEVTLTCKEAFTIYYGDESKTYKAKKKVTIDADSNYLKEGRLKVIAEDEDTPIQILSIERSQGNPSYRGSIEIMTTEKGLAVINELPMEEYLYSVIPSEMPVSYGAEALKTQAVCARSYAYKRLLGNNYSQYGAHIDDSSSYQVYNNYAESKETIEAVKETYGQVIKYQDSVITAYYFSTSCGFTSSMSEVWGGNEEATYLVGRLQSINDAKNQLGQKDEKVEKGQGDTEEVVEVMSSNEISPDFSDESVFRKFLKENIYQTIEQKFAWYRWNTKLSYEQITKNIDERLEKRYETNPNLILTEVEKDGVKSYISQPIQSIGTVTGLEIKERKSSGIITELIIHGTKQSILVRTEYNIRALLAPEDMKITRQDESVVKDLSILPSAFFVFDETKEGDGIQILGGGYGHGVGMSQNGVKALADLQYDYKSIIAYYYKGTTVENIYQ